MSSTPPCCPPGSWPQSVLQTREELNKDARKFEPAGTVVPLPSAGGAPVAAYVVKSAGKAPSLLVLQDIYSSRVLHPSSRSGDRLDAVCDALAKSGNYTVCMPSLFGDKPFDLAVAKPDDGVFEKFNSFAQDGGVDWFKKQSYQDNMLTKVKAAYDYLEKTNPGQPVAVLGFCFGAWLLSKASADFDFKCAIGCHPATVLETAVFGGDEIAMLKALRQPTLFLWAGNDSTIFVEDGEGKAALEATGGGVEEYKDMLHGWVARGDLGQDTVKRDFEKALASIIRFLGKQL